MIIMHTQILNPILLNCKLKDLETNNYDKLDMTITLINSHLILAIKNTTSQFLSSLPSYNVFC